MSTVVQCAFAQTCSGCDFIGEGLEIQRDRKIRELQSLLLAQKISFPEIQFVSPGLAGLRDRLDFGIENGRLGLYAKSQKQIVDLPDCPQLSPPLGLWYQEFRKNLPPVSRLSVRLRIAPDGTRGFWLDLANEDLKKLLDKDAWLRSWPSDIKMEAGQRRKTIARGEGRAKLIEPQLFPWFSTRWRDQDVPLYGAIGSFTQPSLKANRFIADWVQENVLRLKPKKIVEFGTGQGNLSFPALSGEARLVACENDSLALAGFQKSLERFPDLKSRVTIEPGDYLRKPSPAILDSDFLLVNPARAGLGAFLDPLPQAKALKNILSMSCHPASFSVDAKRLQDSGFQIEKIEILDQFPQTKHYEIFSIWNR